MADALVSGLDDVLLAQAAGEIDQRVFERSFQGRADDIAPEVQTLIKHFLPAVAM